MKKTIRMKLRRGLTIKALLAALLLAGMVLTAVACGASGSTLEKNQWFLKSYGQPDNLKVVLADTEITATFDGNKGEVRGSSGCNTYFGAYEVNGDKLSVAEVAATERGCISPPASWSRSGSTCRCSPLRRLSRPAIRP